MRRINLFKKIILICKKIQGENLFSAIDAEKKVTILGKN